MNQEYFFTIMQATDLHWIDLSNDSVISLQL